VIVMVTMTGRTNTPPRVAKNETQAKCQMEYRWACKDQEESKQQLPHSNEEG